MSVEKKTCPYCGSEIQKDVKKCKFCGEWLVLQEKDKPKNSLHIGAFIEAIICIILIVCMFTINYSDGVIVAIFSLYILLHIYFLPALIADKKRTQYSIAIFALNLLLGVTIIAWIGCLVWALTLPDLSKNETKIKNKNNKDSEDDDENKNVFELAKEQIKNPRVVIGWLIFLVILFAVIISVALVTDDSTSNGISKNVYDEYSEIEPEIYNYKGIDIMYNPSLSTEKEVKSTAEECYSKGKTNAEDLNQCIGIKLKWF